MGWNDRIDDMDYERYIERIINLADDARKDK
jgi:hypothetical protein